MENYKIDKNYKNYDIYNQNINNNNYEDNNNKINNSNIEKSSLYNYMHISNNMFPRKIKPNLIRLMSQIFYNSEILEPILNYLDLIELSQFRALNHNILYIVHEYFKKREK